MDILATYQKMSRYPGGRALFTKVVCMRAPYFSSIAPRVEHLERGRCEVTVKKHRAVHNHIGTVHAIACCNMCEMACGVMIEASLPKHLRWIPKGMTVQYLKKAGTDLRAVCQLDGDFAVGDNVIPVSVLDTAGVEVVHADINMYVSERPPR